MVRNHLTESDTVPPTGSAISGLSRLVDRRSLDMIEASRLDDGDEDDLMVIPPIVSGGNGDPEKKEEERTKSCLFQVLEQPIPCGRRIASPLDQTSRKRNIKFPFA